LTKALGFYPEREKQCRANKNAPGCLRWAASQLAATVAAAAVVVAVQQ